MASLGGALMPRNVEGLSWKGYEGQDYEGFWVGPGKQYLDFLERSIVAHALPGGEAIVEIGAGFGRLGTCYVAKYRSVHMVEPATNLREIAARTYGDAASYHEASVYRLPFADASFDAVLMVRVFHHLAEPETAMREIHRVLKRGGRFVFNYSNKRNVRRIASYCLGSAPNPFTLAMENYEKSLIGHHPQHIEGLLKDIGFNIKEQYGVGLLDKLINVFPSLLRIARPSIRNSRAVGRLRLAPAQFIVAEKA
jgi:ubiquinone/menaquinone biosynthesis C-methylase UbiE